MTQNGSYIMAMKVEDETGFVIEEAARTRWAAAVLSACADGKGMIN